MRARDLKLVGLTLAVVLAAGIVAQIVDANVGGGWTGAIKDGEVGAPGTKTLRLPAGTLDISLRQLANSVSVPPSLGVTITGADGRTVPVTRDVGHDFGPNGKYTAIAYRRVWTLDVPAAGPYEVVAQGPGGDAGNTLTFGHAPARAAGTIWAITGIAVLVALLVSGGITVLRRGREPALA